MTSVYIDTNVFYDSYSGNDYVSGVSVLGNSLGNMLMMTPDSPSDPQTFQKRKKSHADVEKVRRQRLKESFAKLKAALWDSRLANVATRRHTLEHSLNVLVQLKAEVYELEHQNQQLRVDLVLRNK
eukprot:NODE_916_length_3098_cov_0.162721.p2 type:complete len:126 gc:universal NODE_916_length_3098_cov_0.162721:527-904(+)